MDRFLFILKLSRAALPHSRAVSSFCACTTKTQSLAQIARAAAAQTLLSGMIIVASMAPLSLLKTRYSPGVEFRREGA